MLARLVAKLANVDLDRTDAFRGQRSDARQGEGSFERPDGGFMVGLQDAELPAGPGQWMLLCQTGVSHEALHADLGGDVAHLQAMHERRSALDRRGHVDSLGHLL